jgi:zinc transporter ZupT
MMSVVLLVALSTHAVFEGIALGLTGDMASTINIILGLMFHKAPASMSLGISLSKNFKND